MTKKERVRKILTDQILVDLNRVAVALSSPQDVQGAHTDAQFRQLQTGGRLEMGQDKIARQAAIYSKGHQKTMPKELAEFVDGEIKSSPECQSVQNTSTG